MPDPRPRNDSDLRFTRRGRVRWFTPSVLASTGQRVLLSSAMGDFLDKRELQHAFPTSVITHGSEGEGIWVDFVADSGDGFDATYSIAWLAAQPELRVDGLAERLPRPGLLILGGDEVYPAATPADYEDRFRGPYKASLPYTETESPKLAAIPGNHDWYDGLTNFMRVFCSADDKWIGGRRLVQSRSYFSVKLANGWWLWGIDIQFDSYIDDPQLQYFKNVASSMEDARLILCTATPSWTDVQADPQSFRNLAYFETTVIRPAGIHLMVSISGDSHHYARYTAQDGTHKITAGGGGAFLHPTHHLDNPLEVPIDPLCTSTRRYELQRRYPEASTSRWLSLGAIRLPLTNPQFMIIPAVLYLLLGWASQFAVRAVQSRSGPLAASLKRFGYLDQLGGLLANPVSVLLLLLVWGGLTGFAKPSPDLTQGPWKLPTKALMGFIHLGVQVAVGGLVGLVAIDVASWFASSGGPYTVTLLAVLAVLGALTGTVLMGAYLAVCCALLRTHGNEAFSAMGLTGHKNFLRLHIAPDGVLTVYAIGLKKAHRRWRYDPDNADPSAPWLAPDGGEPRCHLLETFDIDPSTV